MQAVSANKILVRLEDLNDQFDFTNKTSSFDLESYAAYLKHQAKADNKMTSKITEMSIDGLQTKQKLAEIMSKHEDWLSDDKEPKISVH